MAVARRARLTNMRPSMRLLKKRANVGKRRAVDVEGELFIAVDWKSALCDLAAYALPVFGLLSRRGRRLPCAPRAGVWRLGDGCRRLGTEQLCQQLLLLLQHGHNVWIGPGRRDSRVAGRIAGSKVERQD